MNRRHFLLSLATPRRKILIARGQCPDAMQVIRQHDPRIKVE
jgi:hypothetical protein